MHHPRVTRTIDAAPADVWDALIDLDAWPRWGPSVRRARLEGGGRRLRGGARGVIVTAVGVTLPFEVTTWIDGSAWSWSVAGVAATAHGVGEVPGGRCRAWMDVPAWAPGYLPVCWWALRRIDHLVRAG